MKGFTRENSIVPYSEAYPQAQRIAHAEQHIIMSAELGWMEQTQSRHVAQTYGVPHMIDRLKQLKAKFRNELSFQGGDK